MTPFGFSIWDVFLLPDRKNFIWFWNLSWTWFGQFLDNEIMYVFLHSGNFFFEKKYDNLKSERKWSEVFEKPNYMWIRSLEEVQKIHITGWGRNFRCVNRLCVKSVIFVQVGKWENEIKYLWVQKDFCFSNIENSTTEKLKLYLSVRILNQSPILAGLGTS